MKENIVAVFNTSPDTVELLRVVLQQAGFLVASAFTYDIRDGRVDLDRFVRQNHPAVVVYDVAPPYDTNWALLQNLRAEPALQRCQFVITSTNAAYVQRLAGRDEQIYEIVGKPYDLDLIVRAVKEAVRVRSVR
jgi:CheY-like chemotaxis protein